MSNRTTQERLIRRFGPSDIRAAIIEHLRSDGLSILSDEAVEKIARDLAGHERQRQQINQQNRASWSSPSFKAAE